MFMDSHESRPPRRAPSANEYVSRSVGAGVLGFIMDADTMFILAHPKIHEATSGVIVSGLLGLVSTVSSGLDYARFWRVHDGSRPG